MPVEACKSRMADTQKATSLTQSPERQAVASSSTGIGGPGAQQYEGQNFPQGMGLAPRMPPRFYGRTQPGQPQTQKLFPGQWVPEYQDPDYPYPRQSSQFQGVRVQDPYQAQQVRQTAQSTNPYQPGYPYIPGYAPQEWPGQTGQLAYQFGQMNFQGQGYYQGQQHGQGQGQGQDQGQGRDQGREEGPGQARKATITNARPIKRRRREGEPNRTAYHRDDRERRTSRRESRRSMSSYPLTAAQATVGEIEPNPDDPSTSRGGPPLRGRDRPYYWTVAQVANHRTDQDRWALLPDGKHGFNVLDVSGEFTPMLGRQNGLS